MKRSKFSEQQIAFILRKAEEGTRVEQVCRKAGIPVQTFDHWRDTKYGGQMPSETKHQKRFVGNLSEDVSYTRYVSIAPSALVAVSGISLERVFDKRMDTLWLGARGTKR